MKKNILKFFTFIMLMAALTFGTIACETDSTTGKDDVGGIDKEELTGEDSLDLRRGTPEGGQSEGSLPDTDDE